VAYTVVVETTDKPQITVAVTGASPDSTTFFFGTVGSVLGPVENLQDVFTISGVTAGGSELRYRWQNRNEIVVENGSQSEFSLTYTMDATSLRRGPPGGEWQFSLFRDRALFFMAHDVLLLPAFQPEGGLTVTLVLPEGMEVFTPLESMGNTTFRARRDLWDDLVLDFQKANFIGGRPEFTAEHETAWGDEYVYIWFDWGFDDGQPWLSPQAYMELTEKLAAYFRDQAFGPLPPHTVLFTHGRWGVPGLPEVKPNGWFSYMQIWPVAPAPEIAHHLAHQYAFWPNQSKLPVGFGSRLEFLREGLHMYFQQTVPDIVLGQEHNTGKLFEFFALDRRGQRFNIRSSDMHVTYNMGAMKVYLLDRFIREVTGGQQDVTSFTRALWDSVKDNTKLCQIGDDEVIAAFARVVGEGNRGRLVEIAALEQFDRADFEPLLPEFERYTGWMADTFFGGSVPWFLAYIDVAAARGDHWPHYATGYHNVGLFRSDLLSGVREYLRGKSQALTPAHVEAALSAATGQDHTGFFAFWADFGFEMDPQAFAETFNAPLALGGAEQAESAADSSTESTPAASGSEPTSSSEGEEAESTADSSIESTPAASGSESASSPILVLAASAVIAAAVGLMVVSRRKARKQTKEFGS